jgi:hypothetical protein
MHNAQDDHVADFAYLVWCPRLLGPAASGARFLRSQTLGRGGTTSPDGVVRPLLAHHPVACPAPLRVDEARRTRRDVHATTPAGRTTTACSSPGARHCRASSCPRQSSLCARVRSLPEIAGPTPERSLDLGSRRVAGGHPVAVRARRLEPTALAAHTRSPGRLVSHPGRIREGDRQRRAAVIAADP